MIFIGVDPGLDGFISWFDDADHKIYFKKTPSLPGEKKGRNYDGESLAKIFGQIINLCDIQSPDDVFVAIERVSIFPIKARDGSISSNPGSNAKQFYCAGLFHGIFYSFKFPFVEVYSKTWKAEILKGTPKDKGAAIAYVQKRFPSLGLSGMLKKDKDNLADSICIGLYGERLHGGNR